MPNDSDQTNVYDRVRNVVEHAEPVKGTYLDTAVEVVVEAEVSEQRES